MKPVCFSFGPWCVFAPPLFFAPLVFVLLLFLALGGLGLGALWLPPQPSPFCFLHCASQRSGWWLPSPALCLLFCAPLVSAFLLFRALGALGLGALWLPVLTSSLLSCFLCAPAVRCFPPLAALGLGSVGLGFFFLPRARPFMWCVSCALVLPPPGRLLLVFCAVPRLPLWCRGLVWAVLWGLRCFLLSLCAALCWCAGALLFGVLSCCIVGFVACCLVLALAPPFPLVSCGALLCRAVLCGVLSCVVPSCEVVCCGLSFGAIWSRGALCRLGVWSAVFCCVVLVVLGCPALPPPPPCCCARCRGCCCCLVPCRGPLLCSVLGCRAVLFCCAAYRALCCCLRRFLLCGALLLHLRWLVQDVVACCFSVFVAWSACPLLSFGGVLCRWFPCLAAWPAALLCAVENEIKR